MAKGKYKVRKENRDASQLEEELAQVRVKLEEEQRRLAQVRERVTVDVALRAELAAAVAARDAACAPHLSRIAADRDVIRVAARQLVDVTKGMARHWEKIGDWGWKEFGPENYYAILTGDRAYLTEGVVSSRLTESATELIQRARGIRKTAPVDFTAEQRRALAEAAASASGMALPDDVTGVDGQGWDAFVDRVQDDTAAAIAFKSPPPWLDIATDVAHPVSKMLGACSEIAAATDCSTPGVVPTVAELSTGSAALRDAATAAGATAIAEAFIGGLQRNVTRASRSAISSVVADSAAYPAPADAAAMQAWYSVCAMGAWGRQRTTQAGRVAVAAAAAVPFWLPPGHTIAYLDSEPLSVADLEEIRMPFAQVLVTFAEPARLPAIDPSVLVDDRRVRWIDHLVGVGSGVPDLREMVVGATDNFQESLPTLWDAIAGRGAHIEAILLLADAHGRLDDLFAWCITVPSLTAGRTLGRWVIPASRRATSYANLVGNAAAVAAWAEWHRPGHARAADEQGDVPGGDGGGPARTSHGEDMVHVLNVTLTAPSPEGAVKGEPTGRTTAPHRRRGHWRRQHFGPGRSQTRRVRIAPVLVNAGRVGSERPQVYRLPMPKASQEYA